MNMIPYSELKESVVYTSAECAEYYTPPVIMIGVLGILLGVLAFIILSKMGNYRIFIKESKLQDKYQEWRKLNKGL